MRRRRRSPPAIGEACTRERLPSRGSRWLPPLLSIGPLPQVGVAVDGRPAVGHHPEDGGTQGGQLVAQALGVGSTGVVERGRDDHAVHPAEQRDGIGHVRYRRRVEDHQDRGARSEPRASAPWQSTASGPTDRAGSARPRSPAAARWDGRCWPPRSERGTPAGGRPTWRSRPSAPRPGRARRRARGAWPARAGACRPRRAPPRARSSRGGGQVPRHRRLSLAAARRGDEHGAHRVVAARSAG